MTDNTTISDEEYQKATATKARYESQQAYKRALVRQTVYDQVKPIVTSAAFLELQTAIKTLRETGPQDDHFFSMGVEAIYNGMNNLRLNVENWSTPVDPDAPLAPAPTPSTEGNTDG
ncbi:hypothetical protein MOP88_14420 [Sphingomonas sp. WKB10]|nr:hypothetical protein [Sphingomonas sp. WKB10]